ncbi:MAG: Fe-S cluster assembly protein HesB [Opitutae bacterium]|nr:Fe-S cluster assembly protein HesB [Opitutae bacterium]
MQPSSNVKIPEEHPLSSTKALESFGNELLAWYDEHKRKLPWRTSPSLYKTVVSEFMLQQTRISTVLPYFDRWLEKFPDFASLASAPEEKVVKAWEGLGYYSRARNLRKLAKEIQAFDAPPEDPETWQTFPGVGPYVSAAVTSISFGSASAVADGNVVRILTRIFSIDEQFKDGGTAQRKLRPLAQALLFSNRPGDYNQAVMELGATVCNRRSPLCMTCPVLQFCRAGQSGDAEAFPKIDQKKVQRLRIDRLWMVQDGALLLHKTPDDSKRLAGLYELPRPEDLPDSFRPKKTVHITTKRRAIANQSIEERILRAELKSYRKLSDAIDLEFIPFEKLNEVTLSGPHRKWVEELQKKLDFPEEVEL